MDRAAFASSLSRHRKALGLSQLELAERAGMSRNGLCDLERGLSSPRRETVEILAEALGLDEAESRRFKEAARLTRRREEAGPSPAGEPLGLEGREAELAALDAFLAGAAEAPSLLVLRGRVGVGLSRLLEECASRASRGGWTVLRARHSRWDGLSTLGLVLQLRALAPDDSERWARDYPLMARLCEPEGGEEFHGILRERKQSLAREIVRAAAELSGPSGFLLAIDDLQWIAEDGLSALHCLGEGEPSPRLAVAAALIQEEAPAGGALERYLDDMARRKAIAIRDVAPLDGASALRMAARLARDRGVALRLDEGELLALSGGLPAYIECIAGAGAEAGSAAWLRDRTAGAWASLSEGAQDAVGLAALAEEALSPTFLYGALERLGKPGSQACAAIEEAQAAGLVQELAGGLACEPRLLREAAAEAMGAARRGLYHRVLAEETLAQGRPELAARAAQHFEAAGLLARAAEQVELLGARLEADGELEEASRRYERMIGLMGIEACGEIGLRLLSRLLLLKERARDYAYIEDRAAEAIGTLQSRGLVAEQLPFQAVVMKSLRVQGRYAEAQDRMRSFSLVAEALPPSSELVKYLCEWGYLHYCLADFAELKRILDVAEAKAPAGMDNRARYLLACARMRYHGAVGEYEATRDIIRERIMPNAEAAGMEREYQVAAVNLSQTLEYLGDFAGAEECVAGATARMTIPDSPQLGRARANAELSRLFRRGDWDRVAEEAASLSRGREKVAFLAEALLIGYRVAWLRRRDEEALRLLARMEEAGIMEEEKIAPDILGAERSFLERDYRSAALRLAKLDDPPWSALAGLEPARALRGAARALAQGTEEACRGAAAELSEALDLAERSGRRPAVAEILFYRAWLGVELGDARAREDLAAALESERSMGRAYEEARCLGLASIAGFAAGGEAEAAFRRLGAEAPWLGPRLAAAAATS